ncbi:Uncharacterised protein r2_g1032 [Pycnogonum litorale]
MVDSFMNHAPSGAVGLCTKSGWTDINCFLKWLKHFVKHVKPSIHDRHILIVDGHNSHKSLEAIEYARANGIIIMISLPPHCTHKMQPLDRSYFKSLKNAYNQAVEAWMLCHKGRRMSFYEICEIFSVAYSKSSTMDKGVNGFQVCGLWPFDENIFGDDEFVACDMLTADKQQGMQNSFDI